MVAESYYPNLDGGAVFARSLAESLRGTGHEICVITWRDFASYPHHETMADVPITRVAPTRRWGMLGRYVSMFTVAAELLRRRRQYDLILVSNLRILGLPGVLVARSLRKPCILRADSCGELSGEYVSNLQRRNWVRDMLGSLYFRARNCFLRRADAFIAISTAVRSEFLQLGVQPDRIRLVPNGVDIDVFAPPTEREKAATRERLGLPAEKVILAYSGRLTREKGLHMLLRAWRTIHQEHPDAHLLLIGSGKDMPLSCEDDLRASVLQDKLTSSVTFTGAVNRVHDYLKCADIFVFPSRTEALGVALIEAMACELPAIGTDVGGIPDVIAHGVNGVLIRRDEEQDLISAARNLIEDVALRRRMGKHARKTAISKFSLREIADQYVAVVDVLLTDRAGRGIT